MTDVRAALLEQLERRGRRASIVPIERLGDLREEIKDRHRKGQLADALYRERLSHLALEPPDGLAEARSLIVVATHQPAVQFTFHANSRPVHCMVPPTYLHSQRTDRQVQADVEEILRPFGYQVMPAGPPKKLLAARSGLAAYGRNNVSYVPGMGSFHRLTAFCSDLPAPPGEWSEPAMMERCRDCSLCRRDCPTGAIPADRFLLRAEKCIVLHNEEPSDVPFPDWLDPNWHDCLVGCLRCQRRCPENRQGEEWVEEGADFSAEETGHLLAGTTADQLPGPTVQKLEATGLLEFLDVLPRNLRVLLQRPERSYNRSRGRNSQRNREDCR